MKNNHIKHSHLKLPVIRIFILKNALLRISKKALYFLTPRSIQNRSNNIAYNNL